MKNRQPPVGGGVHNIYVRHFESHRAVSYVVATEEGLFAEGEVPEDYAGAQLTIELCHAVFIVNSLSELQIIEFSTPEILDRERKVICKFARNGTSLNPPDFEPPADSSSFVLEQNTIQNSALDQQRVDYANWAIKQFNHDVARTAGEIPS